MPYTNPFTTETETQSSGEGGYQNPFQPETENSPPPLNPSMAVSPATNTIKNFFQGKGYGASNLTDPYSHKPLLTYENQKTQSSQLLSDRTAYLFDPTIPQKLDRGMFSNSKDRLPLPASAPIKAHLGGGYSDELDHKIALEVGGSNDVRSNLIIEAGRRTKTSLPNGFDIMHPSTWIPAIMGTSSAAHDALENKLATDVVNGKMSLLDAQRALAKAKGFALPEDASSPSINSIQPSTTIPNPHNQLPIFQKTALDLSSKNPTFIGPPKSTDQPIPWDVAGYNTRNNAIKVPFSNTVLQPLFPVDPQTAGFDNLLNSAVKSVSEFPEQIINTVSDVFNSIFKGTMPKTSPDVPRVNTIVTNTKDAYIEALNSGYSDTQAKAIGVTHGVIQFASDFGFLYPFAPAVAKTLIQKLPSEFLNKIITSEIPAMEIRAGLTGAKGATARANTFISGLSNQERKELFGVLRDAENMGASTITTTQGTEPTALGKFVGTKPTETSGFARTDPTKQLPGYLRVDPRTGAIGDIQGEPVGFGENKPQEETPLSKTYSEQVTIPKELQPLAQEARKYKSAEEFVNSRKYLYHGTDEVSAGAIEKNGFKIRRDEYAPNMFKEAPVFLTDKPETAKLFADYKSGQIDKNPKVIQVDVTGMKLKRDVPGGDFVVTGDDIQKLKTKSQLTDFYNKAVGEKPLAESMITDEKGNVNPEQNKLENALNTYESIHSASLKDVGLNKEPSPWVQKRESTLLAERMKTLARGSRMGSVGTRSQVMDVQREVTDIINKSNLDLKDKGKFLASIKNVQTPDQLKNALPEIRDRIARLDETATKNDLLATIKGELGENLYTGKGDKRVSKYSPSITKKLLQFREELSFKNPESLRMKQLEITAKWIEDHPSEPMPDDVIEQLDELQRTHLKLLSIPELEEQLSSIQSLKTQGKTYHELKVAQIARQRAEVIDQFKDIITGGKGIAPGRPVITSQENGMWLQRFDDAAKEFLFYRQLIPDNAFDILDEKSGTPLYQGKIHHKFIGIVNTSRDARIIGIQNAVRDVQKALEKVNPKAWGKIVDFGGGVKMTRNEMLDIYISSHDSANLESIIEGNKIPQAKIDHIISALTPQEKEVGDSILAHWANSYEGINNVFREKHFFDMPKSEGQYVPMVKDMDYVGDEDINLLKQQLEYAKASVSKGFTKARTGSIAPIRLDAIGKYADMVARTEHYKAFELGVQEMNSILKGIKESVVQERGMSYYRMLEEYIKRVANQGKYDQSYLSKQLLTLRASASTGILGLNPVTSIKHMIASIGGALSELGERDFFHGIYKYFSNKSEWDTFWDKVPQFAERAKSFTREIQEVGKQKSPIQTFLGKTSLREKSMFLLRIGDKNVVRSEATAVYLRSLRNGATEKEAIANAVSKLRRTQTGGAPEDMPALMSGGSWEKMLTMFMSEKNKYLNLLYGYSRAYAKGRIGFGQLARVLLYAWVFNGMAMEEVRKGGKANASDLAKAVALGPLEDLLVIGSLIESIRTGYQYEATPVFSLLNNIKTYITDMTTSKNFLKGLGGIGETASTMAGIPIRPFVTAGTGLTNILQGKTQDWRQLIWSPSALGEKVGSTKATNPAADILKKYGINTRNTAASDILQKYGIK